MAPSRTMKAQRAVRGPLSFETRTVRAPQDEDEKPWRVKAHSAETRPYKKKKDQLALAQCVEFCVGPALTIPGGWGLRNPKPKEPDQRSIFFSQARAAGDWPNWGGIVIPSNDPVTSGTMEFRSMLES